MKTNMRPENLLAWALVFGVLFTAGCSGSREDVRVTLCKNLTNSLLSSAESAEWTGGENTFNRPSYAVTSLTFDVAGGVPRSATSACYYAYDALDETAQTLADPLSAHATLPFKMTFDGRTLSDEELLRLVNEEQKRQGRQAVARLEKGARDMADKVRAGIGQ